ncbi:hypothetical protein AV530_000017 [Patagioenas fasciata monilis]|uniref:Uncharacterized protein n=1 Tax=Patagioenas fasciata monilis TaxID=372326 RepID=A0A1V4K329_PATFA|nr:hypothetical protein AV530_000017 [Patagioenas fasciata monilis]
MFQEAEKWKKNRVENFTQVCGIRRKESRVKIIPGRQTAQANVKGKGNQERQGDAAVNEFGHRHTLKRCSIV